MVKIFKITFLLFVVLTLFVACSREYLQYASEQEAFSLVATAAKEAIAETDFASCLRLPVEARYYDERTSTDNVVIEPRAYCLWQYMEAKGDIRVCNLLEKFGAIYGSGIGCFDYLGTKSPLQDQCKKISEPDETNTCLVLVNKDIQYCQKLGSNVSKGWCIHDVVFRTRNIKSCLQIDGPDYGEN